MILNWNKNKTMKCEDKIHPKGTNFGYYIKCDKNAKWLITSEKAFNDKPFSCRVCTYHKNQLVQHFDRINVKYKIEKI